MQRSDARKRNSGTDTTLTDTERDALAAVVGCVVPDLHDAVARIKAEAIQATQERLDPIDEQAIRRNKRHQELVAEAVRGERKRIARVLSGMADESFYYFDSEAGDALRAAARIVRGEG